MDNIPLFLSSTVYNVPTYEMQGRTSSGHQIFSGPQIGSQKNLPIPTQARGLSPSLAFLFLDTLLSGEAERTLFEV